MISVRLLLRLVLFGCAVTTGAGLCCAQPANVRETDPHEMAAPPRARRSPVPTRPGHAPAQSGGRNERQPPLETLDQAWTAALQIDQGLGATFEELRSHEAAVAAARSERWPTLALQSSYRLRSDEPSFVVDASALGAGINTQPYLQRDEFATRAAVRWPLLTGGRTRNTIASAQSGLDAAAFQVELHRQELKLQVALEYIEVLRSARLLEVARRQWQHVAAHARDVKKLREHGRVSQNDMLAAEVSLADARITMLQAGHRLQVARHAYNRRLGRSLDTPVRLAALPKPPPPGSPDQLVSQAVARRPELAIIDAEAAHLRHEASRLQSQRRPQLHLEAAYRFQENRFQTPEGLSSAAILGVWEPFDGGRTRHLADSLLAQVSALELRRADLQSHIRLDVRRLHLERIETTHRIDVARKAIDQADENLRVARERYRLGAGTNTEVLDAISLRQRALRQFHGAVYDALSADIRMRRAVGQL